ncbi:MAG TPA: carboxypeptidase regulatory-like domain-containing protein [Pyrinomonadaceae bacterium]
MRSSKCSKRSPLVVLGVALIIVCLGLRGGAGATRAAQGQVVTVGVVAFQDESGAEVAPGLVGQLARTLQQKLAATHKDLLPRAVGAEPGAAPAGTLGVEQLAAFGKQRGLKFVVRGGVLAVETSGAGAAVVAQVYAEVVSVEDGELRGVRAEGGGADAGAALNAAVEKLAAEVYRAVVSPSGDAADGAQAPPPSGESDPEAPAPSSADEGAAPATAETQGESDAEAAGAVEADEALQQLIAQAESLAASGAGSADSLGALNRALEGLQRALAAKAARLEQAQDTARADADIASRRQELEGAVSRLTEEAAAAGTTDAGDGAAEGEQTSGEKKKLTTSINDFLGESLSILQKIQEMRALLRGAGEEQSSAGGDVGAGGEDGDAGGASAPAEEATEEVSGVVTEGGEPVEGLSVTEAESGRSTTTGADGTYTLKGVPAGRLTNLVLTKAGARVATARLDLPRGRSAVADFELKAKAGARAAASPLRVVPSTVFVKASKAGAAAGAGTLKGTVRGANGQPLARALVTLHQLAVARTDSAGRYTFLNVPAGAHQLTIYRSGLRAKTERVHVTAKKSSESRVAFASGDKTDAARTGGRLLVRGAGTVLRGSVLGQDDRPLAGAKVSVVETGAQGGGAVAALANRQGGFELRDLKPGSYRVLVSKAGYEPVAQSVSLTAGASRPFEFRLKRMRAPFLDRALEARNVSRANRPAAEPRRAAPQAATPGGNRPGERRAALVGSTRPQPPAAVSNTGQLSGLVVDAKTGRPVAGAAVSVAGLGRATTNRAGSFFFPQVAPGTHRINVRLKGYGDAVATANVRGGQRATLSLRLLPAVAPARIGIR